MWRVEVTEIGRTPLPPIDLDLEALVIGSGEDCQLRLPARAVRPHHLRLRRLGSRPLRMEWQAGAAVEIDGVAREAGASGEAEKVLVAQVGGYRLQITEAEPSSVPTSPQRTESLVREMIRNIMGGAAPRLIVEEGPAIGSSRTLAPPDSRMTVGRGDEADWVILDEDLSRVHAALVRTWDGVTIVDLGSKNGTRVDGELVPAGEGGQLLRDGARITLGDVVVRYRDDAETYLLQAESAESSGDGAQSGRAEAPASRPSSRQVRPAKTPTASQPALRLPTAPIAPALLFLASSPAPSGSSLLIGIGLAVAAAAIGAAIWLLGG